MAGILMDTGVPLNININLAKPIPVNTPTIPPIEVSTTASVKNWNRMAFFLAPIAFLRPSRALGGPGRRRRGADQ